MKNLKSITSFPWESTVLAHLILRLPELQALVLFGSCASGRQGADSDIDLAVLTPQPLAPWPLFQLAQELADICNRDVDLIDLRSATTVLAAQIISTGEIISAPSQQEYDSFAGRIYADYARLNEERRPVLLAYGVAL